MNKNKLKSYAPQARREFIRAVGDRAALLGLSADGVHQSVQVSGEVAIIGGRPHPARIAAQRRQIEERIAREGYAAMIEEIAYTWFNRLTALRYMELHNYLGHGLRVLSHPSGGVIPEILEKAERVELPNLTRERVVEMKLDGNRDAELYRALLVAQCNALSQAMPFLFERINDATELLLPDNLLHSDSLLRKLVTAIDESDWERVEIIGWLYQFYISERKDEVIGRVVKSEDIPAATQLFTPNWIVKYMVQNSVGRMWLQTYPSSPLKAKMEYYIEPAQQSAEVAEQLKSITPEMIDPETITILDPACGSGHILVEAYDVLKEIYQERGYRQRDIARLILGKNLYGTDIDERAAQLSGFALLMKARADDRGILDDAIQPNVTAIAESAAINAEELAGALLKVTSKPRVVPIIVENNLWGDMNRQQSLMVGTATIEEAASASAAVSREDIVELLDLFKEGKTLGSLITVPDALTQKLPAIKQIVDDNLNSGELYAREAANTLLPFIRQAEVLAGKYDCVIANPPYMGSRLMNDKLKAFAAKNFPDGKSDLFAMFIERGFELLKRDGFNAMVTMESWMFLPSYQNIRERILSLHTIYCLIHLPYEGRGVTAMGISFGISAFSIRKQKIAGFNGSFSFSRHFELNGNGVPITFPSTNERLSQINVDKFSEISGSPIAYWVSDKVREAFTKGIPLVEIGEPRQGLATSDNDRFLRFWFEINFNKVRLNCENKLDAKTSKAKWFPYNKGGEFRKWFGNNDYVINWENDGQEVLAFASKLYGSPTRTIKNISHYFKSAITWSLTSSAAFGARFRPSGFIFDVNGMSMFPQSKKLDGVLGLLNSSLAKSFLSFINPTMAFQVGDIKKIPFIEGNNQTHIEKIVYEAVTIARNDWDSFETSWDFQLFPFLRSDLKASTVEQSFNNWQTHCNANIKRMQELETENNRLFIEAYGLQDELTPEVPEEQITLARAGAEADVRRLISYAVGCMMGRYSLSAPGLVYANSGNANFDASQYPSFPADDDGIIPVTDDEWFADDACHRFVDFLRVAWSPETLEANLRFVAAQLAPKQAEEPRETIRRYFSTGFFKDHMQTYKRRPIYWLFSSGKARAFECMVYVHRYTPATLSRMRNEYVTPLFGKLSAQIEYLAGQITAAATTAAGNKLRKRSDALKKKLTELQAFDEQLRHYADQRIALDLDDGVRANYGKFGPLLAETKAIAAESEASQ